MPILSPSAEVAQRLDPGVDRQHDDRGTGQRHDAADLLRALGLVPHDEGRTPAAHADIARLRQDHIAGHRAGRHVAHRYRNVAQTGRRRVLLDQMPVDNDVGRQITSP